MPKVTTNLDSSKGGKERARKLSGQKKTEIARMGALARWADQGKTPAVIAKYGGPDRPLRIGPIEIPCYVLADGRRVLTQRGLQGGLGLSEAGGKGASRLAVLMASLEKKGIDCRGLVARASDPIPFVPPHFGIAAHGYEATILPDICAVLIEAGRLGKLRARQTKLAERAAILQHGFATVGIIALVDEATGYQDFRSRDALAKILERFVAKELRPWIRTFPPEYYKQIYRLNRWEYGGTSARPGVIGHWTNNIVYNRLAPGVFEELKRVAPRNEHGKRKHKLFQWLSDEVGSPRLREHLTGVIMLMKYSADWSVFMDRLDKEYPPVGGNLMLPFPERYKAPPTSSEAAGESLD